jgi:hypothetical protein
MKIHIETIKHDAHRYSTFGDWWRDAAGTWQIRVSEMKDHRDEILCAVHELVEAVLCEDNGVKEEAVTAFDVAHPNAEEPGELKDAPYHWEHFTAETIERLLAIALRRDWRDYMAACNKLFE